MMKKKMWKTRYPGDFHPARRWSSTMKMPLWRHKHWSSETDADEDD